MKLIESLQELEEQLATPSSRDVDSIRRIQGDIVILGAGGKMGPSLARRIKRAIQLAGVEARLLAVSRFSSAAAARELNRDGVETIACDFLNRDQVRELPLCPNVLFLSGRKFGSTDRPDLTWATNTMIPAQIAFHYRRSRIVAFSTGNVYPLVKLNSGGSVETDSPGPVGEYAQSCLGRERMFEYHSKEYGTPCLLFRLNYAVDLRYGVLVDIARKVYIGEPVDLSVPAFNAIWQGDANSYALRSLELCSTPARAINVTGPETISVRRAAEFFAAEFNREAVFCGDQSDRCLISNASLCHSLLGYPEVSLGELMQWVAHWVERGGESLNKPTRFEVADGRF
ncbi:MAG TPA: NAD(P)-dependent oxidoreductase [Terriglobia bacterium]|nr:NAD(P)-dependent oxidoreductase [Terriglobia bacterium]